MIRPARRDPTESLGPVKTCGQFANLPPGDQPVALPVGAPARRRRARHQRRITLAILGYGVRWASLLRKDRVVGSTKASLVGQEKIAGITTTKYVKTRQNATICENDGYR